MSGVENGIYILSKFASEDMDYKQSGNSIKIAEAIINATNKDLTIFSFTLKNRSN